MCLGCSALYHLFMCQDMFCYHFFARLDFAGIVMLIMGSVFPLTYYSFACSEVHILRNCLLTAMVVSAIIVTTLMMLPYFQRNDTNKERAWTLMAYGVVVALPIAVRYITDES